MLGISIRQRGPLLAGKGPAEVQEAMRGTIKELVAEGERAVKLQLYPRHGLLTGNYRRSIHGELENSLHGRVHDSNIVYGPWLEGISSRNATTRFKGYAMFRNATQQLQRMVGNVLDKYVRRAAGGLS